MIYEKTNRFLKSFDKLPPNIQQRAIAALDQFIDDSKYPSLRVKLMKGQRGIWEARVDDFYRFTFEYDKDTDTGERICRFRNIGRHEILDRNP